MIRKMPDYCAIYQIKGQFHIHEGGFEYIINPGDFLLLRPNILHYGTKASEGRVEYFWIHFNAEAAEQSGGSLLEAAKDCAYLPTVFKPQNFDKLVVIMNQIMDIYSQKNYTDHLLKTIVKLALYETTNQYLNQHWMAGYDKKFAKLLEWIRLNAYKAITLEEIANEFEYNQTYLSAKFKKVMNKTVSSYINEVRIENAKKYLTNTNHTIKQIAYISGFSDEKYFMRIFKHYVHMTPTKFRNAYAKVKYNNE